MAPAGQGINWSDVLCCVVCSKVFDKNRKPINLVCGHVVCVHCLTKLDNVCPADQTEFTESPALFPINTALLSIATGQTFSDQQLGLVVWGKESTSGVLSNVEKSLAAMSRCLRKTESERGGSVWSEILSRTMQRKLMSLLCFQLADEDGRSRALKTCRAISDRIITEILLSQQNSSHLSTQLWTAVRARGCQFLGPAMQEDVLKLILLTLEKGALIARKTLVMYVVQMLSEDYPQVSKTCVGHVVQLLYRASCFNVMKRDGESSLMQLKEDFRTYENLRREHDAQIVQMAIEAGLRISPDQWSSLLYGDQSHRSHMQSIIDKLQTPQSYMQGIDELAGLANKGDQIVSDMLPYLRSFENVHPTHHEKINWSKLAEHLESMEKLIQLHVGFLNRRNELRINRDHASSGHRWSGNNNNNNNYQNGGAYATEGTPRRYKTRMCRDAVKDRAYPRGNRCTYAHNSNELRGGGAQQEVITVSVPPMPPPPHHTPAFHVPFPNRQPGGPGVVRGHPHANLMMTVPAPSFASQPAPGMMAPADLLHPPPSGTPGPMLPAIVPMMMASPTHQVHSPGAVMMVGNGPMLLPGPPHGQQQSAQGSMWPPAACPTPGPMGPPGALLVQSSPPVVGGPTFWVHSTPTAMYPINHLAWSTSPSDIQLTTVMTTSSGLADMNGFDADQLLLKRREIINRLAPFVADDDDDNDGPGSGHVSYTVASSVLDDRAELQHAGLLMNHPMDMPPISASFPAVQLPPVPTEETMAMLGDLMVSSTVVAGRPRAGSIPMIQTTTVLTVCPTTLLTSEAQQTATVQADSTTMHVMDTINQPLPTAAIQRTQHPTPSRQMPMQIDASTMPPLIRSALIPSFDPQNIVSSTLDKIVDVKERLNEAESSFASSAVSQQLRVELQIAEREMETLDPMTQANCLLRELQHVDRQIEQARQVEGVQ